MATARPPRVVRAAPATAPLPQAHPMRNRRQERSQEHSTVTVSTSGAIEDDAGRREILDVHTFVSDPAYVRVNAGATKNMGNFESMRVDVSVSLPCYPEEVDRAIAKAADLAYSFLNSELEKL